MRNLCNINSFISTISSVEIGIVIAIVVIILIATALYVYNYRCQLRVFLYMDTQGSVYNRKGLEIYLKRNKKKLKTSSLVVINIKNLEHLYQNYPKKNTLITEICDMFLQGMSNVETVARIEFSRFICLFEETDRDKLKEKCISLEEKFNEFEFENYGKFKFEMRFGIYENADLSNPKIAVERTIEILRYSNEKEGNIKYYSDDVDIGISKVELLNKEKNDALGNGSFASYIQPKVDFKTGKIVGGEILVRWLDENNKVKYLPSDFIPTFEQNGFIRDIDILMFKNACTLVNTLVNKGYNDIVISVNISNLLFKQPDFVDNIYNITTELGTNPRNLELEITEKTFMKDFVQSSSIISSLKSKGFNVSMDDFGQEYSSLGSLANNPFDTIKLDQIFFKNRLSTEKSKYIITNIITMLEKLNFKIVCEGVEDDSTLEILSQINRNIIIQGYCYAMPMSLSDFEMFINTVFPMNYAEIVDYKEEVKKKVIEVNTANNEIEVLKQQMVEMKELFQKNLEEQRAAIRNSKDNRNYYDDNYYNGYRDYRLNREMDRMEDEKYGIKRELDELRKAKADAEKSALEARLDAERHEREILLKRLEKLENDTKQATVIQDSNNEIVRTKPNIVDEDCEEEDLDEYEDNFIDDELQSQIDSKIDAAQFQELLKQYLHQYKGSEETEVNEENKNLPTIERINLASKEVKSYYNMIKNAIMEYDGITNKFATRYDLFKNGKDTVFKITYVGKTLKLYLPLDPNAYPPARFHHKDVSSILVHKKTPFMVKIKSDLALKRALILINDAMITLGLSKNPDYKNANYIARNRFVIQKKNTK